MNIQKTQYLLFNRLKLICNIILYVKYVDSKYYQFKLLLLRIYYCFIIKPTF